MSEQAHTKKNEIGESIYWKMVDQGCIWGLFLGSFWGNFWGLGSPPTLRPRPNEPIPYIGRERERERDRETERQRDRETERQRDREAER